MHKVYRLSLFWQQNELVCHYTGISLEASVPVEPEAPSSPPDVDLATRRPLQTHALATEYSVSDVEQRQPPQQSSTSTHQVSTAGCKITFEARERWTTQILQMNRHVFFAIMVTLMLLLIQNEVIESLKVWAGISLIPRPSAASFLVAYVTFEPPLDKLAEGLVPLLHHLQARWTRL